MNPVIVIPSYWAENEDTGFVHEVGVYDHATPITKPVPELQTCLDSLEQVRGILRVVVLLVAPPHCADSARARVNGICAMHPNLNPLIIGYREAKNIQNAIHVVAPKMEGETVSLRGYGAIRNMGLVVAAILGHDVVVFMDDDEVALDENFLIDAVYGLGLLTRQDLPVSAKTGFFYDRSDSCYADESTTRWCERFWTKKSEFNDWMERAQSSTRISRSNYVCGGCFALYADAFCRVAFDPYITRGEDLDYLFNLRMNGLDVWFDNQWAVKHLPPKTASRASRFMQDVYRWTYEVAKIDVVNHRIGLRPITADSLEPYPAPWISPEVNRRIFLTSLLHAIAGPERKEYFHIWLRGRYDARTWAARVKESYLAFQTYWPGMMSALWCNEALGQAILETGVPRLPKSAPRRAKRRFDEEEDYSANARRWQGEDNESSLQEADSYDEYEEYEEYDDYAEYPEYDEYEDAEYEDDLQDEGQWDA
ncbi:MAG: glycosyltransferase [Coriobacteriales bacterium]|nr:glycosyltransferase [Coriobacteriales bacterium]